MYKILTLEDYPSVLEKYILQYNLSSIDINLIVQRVREGLCDKMSPFDLSKFASETAANMVTIHPEYEKLAAIIFMSYHVSVTSDSFSSKVIVFQNSNSFIDPYLYELILKNKEIYDAIPDYSRDFTLSYFSLHTLFTSYLLRINNEVIERPQDIFMRVAIQIHRDDFDSVKQTYDLLSLGYYTHGTPTLLNSLLSKSQSASCFLLSPKGDDTKKIFETITDCVLISKHSGGLGLNLHEIRCSGSQLSSGGSASGIVPIVKIINESIKFINHGSFKRKSSIAIYLEPWHKDIISFMDMRKNTGSEEFRAREIFTAIWMNDLLMERVLQNSEWSLFDPKDAPGLCDVYGEDFKKLYEKYEKTVKRTVISAQTLWKAIIITQIETGTPYIVYKDRSNKLSNQNHLGTIKCSNLCTEIIEYSSKDETAVCNLASVCLPKFVNDNKLFDFNGLKEVVKIIVKNLNKVIDNSFYPIVEAFNSNTKHRPLGIGVQGLADVFALMAYPFESEKARELNLLIFETMYFAALEASMELAIHQGPYPSFTGSLLSKGIFHFELSGAKSSGLWDWEMLRSKIMKHGTRNSLLIALMPTATTSQICGNNECFEPFTSNIYTRRTFAGEFQVVNKHLMKDLHRLGLWSYEMRNLIIDHEGSIQSIPGIPLEIKELYKTVWEIKMKRVLELAVDRQAFIDQSQSMNVFLAQPTYQQLSSMHFYGWKNGLKTGMYYLRTRPISSAIKFTVNQDLVHKTLSSLQEYENSQSERENDKNECESCSA